jgi:preprotein translocase subunit SecA
MFAFLKKIFGTAQSRLLKKYFKIVLEINEWEKKYQSFSEEELKKNTLAFKERFKKGESLHSLLPEAYATVKNACKRLWGTEVHVFGYNQKWDMVPYDVQLLGAIAMHYGSIAEMQTGEGKTLTASLPLYLNALSENPVHLVTVNDYLAKRDCDWIGIVFRYLGLTVSSLTNDVPLHKRKEIYAADIVYGTSSEFGFDYLRDNSMAASLEEQVQRKPYYFAIIDEVDSILIDEARTPLIISGPSPINRQMYDTLKDPVAKLVRLQRDLCNRLATEAKKNLDALGVTKEDLAPVKLAKEEQEKADEAFRKLWLVCKGIPRHKILMRLKENPDLRAQIDRWETYYYSEQNKEEKAKTLGDLFIIVDEKANEYELTDRGINAWSECNLGNNDFVMLDLGYEYAQIDNDLSLEEQEKMERKVRIREEDANRKERAHNLQQLFKAHLLMEKDVDYIVQENKIIIIDENTGRPQPGRRFSDGLHQAIEAKESVAIQGETQTFATITLQNYFRMYEKIAGMTGTAMTEANEFKEIYKLEVVEIPTYCTCNRKDADDEIYMTEREKYVAIIKEILFVHNQGRPILIGTESVEISEKLSRILKQNHLAHTILNAKNHSKEAEIIAEAGKRGAITLATNMAGRGTDIKISSEVKELGGLHVIGTTRHHSRRIDRQLRGRSGRLGDPGSSKFYVSFEDSLMRLFASPRLTSMLQRFRPPEGEPISAKVLNKSIETAQKRIELRNYTIRKHTLEYDDVMNKQRQEIYSFRNELLSSSDPISLAKEILTIVSTMMLPKYFTSRFSEGGWQAEEFRQWLMTHFPVPFEKGVFEAESLDIESIGTLASEKVIAAFLQKLAFQKQMILHFHPNGKEEEADNLLHQVIRSIMIRKIDHLWQEHLLSIDHLRSDVHLRAVGQRDPLMEFKHEAFALFDRFSQRVKLEIAEDFFHFELVPPEQRKLQEVLSHLQMDKERSFVPQPEDEQQPPPNTDSPPPPTSSSPLHAEEKIGRNTDCPCGSGKKYKKCCGQISS